MNIENQWQIGEFQVQCLTSGAPWRENCYLVHHLPSGEQAIIDPGDGAETIAQAVLANGTLIHYLWLTHAHHDHVGAVAALCRRFGLTCELHRNDVRLLRHAPMYALRFAGKTIESPQPSRSFDTPFQFHIGGQPVEIIHTPGHTSGSVCYVFDGFVFSGDTLMVERVGRTDLPGGDDALLKTSISHIVESLPSDSVIFAGHGPTWTVAEAREWWQSKNALSSAMMSSEI